MTTAHGFAYLAQRVRPAWISIARGRAGTVPSAPCSPRQSSWCPRVVTRGPPPCAPGWPAWIA